jgi:hypothetical protein
MGARPSNPIPAEEEDAMAARHWMAWLVAALASCSSSAPGPTPPLTGREKAKADLQASIDDYVRRAPKLKDLRGRLDPNIEALQGDPADPAPTNLALLTPVPDSTLTGLDALSPIVVKAVQARLVESLHREPTANEVVKEIAAVENKQATDVSDALEDRHAEIAALYAEIASLNRQGNAAEARKRRDDLQAIRAEAIAAWYAQHGIAPGKADPSGQALTPDQTAAADRELLLRYTDGDVAAV